MKVEHTRSTGKRLTYTIEADRWGRYSIQLGDKFLWSAGGALGFGQRPGKRLELQAVEAAKQRIEMLGGMPEE